MNRSLTPMKEAEEMTPSVRGSDVESEEEETGEHVMNTKSFSRNSRLITKKPAKRALDLAPSPIPKASTSIKKTGDPDLVKSSAKLRTSTPKKKATPKEKKTPTEEPLPTASQRLANLRAQEKGSSSTIVQTESGALTVTKKTSVGKGPLKKGPVVKPGNKSVNTSASSSTVASGSSPTYNVNFDTTQWYAQQGAEYRRYKEDMLKKKAMEKNPLIGIMQEKSDNIAKMVESMDTFNEKSRQSTATLASSATPEQLWADSLVPQLLRMGQDTRDTFMVYVLGVAMKAISGRWPEEDA